MKLLGSTRSPYVQKVRIALHEKELPYEFLEMSPSSPEVANANPLAKIPTFIRHDGRALYDSSVIIEYVDGLKSGLRLVPSDFESRIEVRRWEALGDGIMDATVAISHENRLAAEKRRGEDFYAKQFGKINSGLSRMDTDLGEREFCHGGAFTLADVACIAALLYLDRTLPDLSWRKANSNLTRHLISISARPSVKALL
jgi:glutathione S-transferase